MSSIAVEERPSGPGEEIEQMECCLRASEARLRDGSDERTVFVRLRRLYMIRAGVAEQLRSAIAGGRQACEIARQAESRLARLDGDLAEIDAILRGE